jgi:hypothetical protein
MAFDLRIPLGLLFLVLGALLGWYGLASDQAAYAASLGVNVNLWWGGAMLLFGAVVLGSAVRKRNRAS